MVIVVKLLSVAAIIFILAGVGFYFWKEETYTFGNPINKFVPSGIANSVEFLSDSAGKITGLEKMPGTGIGAVSVSANLAQYSIESLRKRTYPGSEIKIGKKINGEETFTSYVFTFTTDGKKVTGQANLPKKSGKQPVVVMLRGYLDKEGYFTGLGTRKAAAKFAENGYITLAPDFLGFGGSDGDSGDILEARFEKPITVINLIQSLGSLEQADNKNLFLWGHSNGGQVALLTLEILKKPIPTTLWAPVTRGFPESVTDYIGEMDDKGKMVVATLSAFAKTYNEHQFSVASYYQDITSPIQLHQGTRDELIKEEWSHTFVDKLKGFGRSVNYFVYPKDDHNLSRNWDEVVKRDLEFFSAHIK